VPNVYALARQFRQSLLQRDAAALSRITLAYLPIFSQLQNDLRQLAIAIEAAQAAGQQISKAWLFRQERYQALLVQIARQVDGYAQGLVVPSLTQDQRTLVNLAQQQAAQMIAAQASILDPQSSILASFNRLPAAAVEHLVGAAGDGTPLARLFKGYGRAVAGQVKDRLVAGIATGQSFDKTAREVSQILDRPRWEAARLVRTESLRSYREASRATYAAKGITTWVWLAAHSARTCVACLALDGTEWPIEKPMPNHPNCRCTMVAKLDQMPKRQTGTEWLAQQSNDVQTSVLGQQGAEAFRNGLPLENWIGLSKSKQWGETRYKRSLADAVKGPQKGAVPKQPITVTQPDLSQALGVPVSTALKLPGKGKFAAQADRVVNLINDVHGDGKLPVLPVLLDRSTKRQGGYWTFGGRAVKITISSAGNTYPDVALAHEIGHFLDHQGITAGRYASEIDPRFAAWRQAVENSRAAAELKALHGQGSAAGVKHEYVAYMGKWIEFWARSYSQYIALRSGDSKMLAEINLLRRRTNRVYYPYHWDDDDFEPIAQAIDGLLQTLGWRK